MSFSAEGPRAARDWFVDAFDDLYLSLYAHRDQGEAAALLGSLERFGALHDPMLDLCCGGGRFLAASRRAGRRVFGLDLSPALLRAARGIAPGAPLARGDMRELPWRSGAFGTVVVLFTSFGYFDTTAEDGRVLGEVSRVLREGGFLVLDFLNAARVRDTLVPRSSRQVGELKVEESRWIDETGPFVRKEIVVGDPPTRRFHERVRLYAPDQLAALIEDRGFQVDRLLGGYDGTSFQLERSPRLILIARRPASSRKEGAS